MSKLHFVRRNLREYRLFLQAGRKVSMSVERLRIQTTEVTDSRQRQHDETIQKLIHPLTTQGHTATDLHVLAQTERRHGDA